MTHRPYALLRDVISIRFEILDNVSHKAVQQIMEEGVSELAGHDELETAHMIGQLVGFDFSQSP